MPPYLIELRLQGYSKRYARELMNEIGRNFRLKRMAFSSGGVPHITIYGPFSTYDEQRMVSEVAAACQKYWIIPLKFEGFDYFDGAAKTIYIDIAASEELKKLRFEIAQNLLPITNSISDQDRKSKDGFQFHSTIVFKHINHLFPQIWAYIQSKPKPSINQALLRVTILKNGRILYEYDFMQRRLLNRWQSLNRIEFARTIQILKSKHIENKMNGGKVDNYISFDEYMPTKNKASILTYFLRWLGFTQ